MKYIGLLDCNNFFVSCERLFRPDLHKKPVVVLSSNDGCVVARSQEIKDRGIPMGVPYFQIKDTLSEIGAISFSSHFALYRDISRRVFEVVRTQFENIEQYSIDECFFAFDSDNPEEVATELKRQVERLVGIPVSVGVASSKTRAKYASSVAKKTKGVSICDDEMWNENAENIRLSEIWGVGAARSRKFNEKGIVMVADLLKLEQALVGKLFGVEGVRLQAELSGQSVLGIEAKRALQQSIMHTRSFATTSSSYQVLEDAVKYHLYQGVKDLEMMDLLATSLRVMIAPSRHGDYAFYGASREVTLTAPTNNLFTLQHTALELLKACYKPEIPYKKAGIVLSGLVSPQGQTNSLFADEEKINKDKTSALSGTIFAINKKHGKTLLQLGRTNATVSSWQVRHDAISPSYTTSWSDIKIVRS